LKDSEHMSVKVFASACFYWL